jgi:hypothetical protein
MKIVPYAGRDESGPEDAWLAELEAALNGEGAGPRADSWRELREDVRVLAPRMTPEFESRLRERLQKRETYRRPRDEARRWPSGFSWRARRCPRTGGMAAAALAATLGALVAAVLVAAPWQAGETGAARPARASQQQAPFSANVPTATGAVASEGVAAAKGGNRAGAGASGASANSASAPAASGGPASATATPSPGRVQQLAASIGLSTTPGNVQEVADRVSRLAASDGGFVQTSHVQVQQVGASEANIVLKLPSARLGAALASLGELAPVHDESQSLQDITDEYDAARRRVADATAERQALLRALAKASTQGQIDSLRERLAQARSSIGHANSALRAIAQQASTAEVEVTVLGDAHAANEGLTLHRGLHDAGRVLVVTLAVLLIAAAILVPLALLLLALAFTLRAWRRYRRERALDAP